eukprot:NODE_2118_length_983_cov_64.528908_g1734_i0.p1 GENE.NODE_2118_length_983_cov_64.528908_g1734_i0~~NODE_2118_length_983_cov_64.528908_g1734_i0.p1  ORF type:complete len:319 (+),score=3.71 NODE_2118_length_983_cov_64.528908_g1734_i0:44-958(+)
MGFIKVVKTRAYFKRYQVKFRRRREGKTDYRARRKLVTQDKTKFNSPKYRFVVRFTNKDIIVQIVSSKIAGDVVHCVAYAHELPKFGIKLGLTNYSAAYAVGLLCARRWLKEIGLDSKYEGVKSVDGNFFVSKSKKGDRRPFKCYLDVGLARTTTGSKIFAAMKGAVDGGLLIPHGKKCTKFPGYVKKEKSFSPEMLKDYIIGGHVCDYMEKLKKSDPVAFGKQFKRFIENKITGDDLEEIYLNAHKKIREDPSMTKVKAKDEGYKHFVNKKRPKKLSNQQRKDRVKAKKERLLKELEKLNNKE